jgi:hypothetical protein
MLTFCGLQCGDEFMVKSELRDNSNKRYDGLVYKYSLDGNNYVSEKDEFPQS